MELPSMVHRSGGTLIVRSVVSGHPIYMDQEPSENANNINNNNNNNKTNNMNSPQTVGVGNSPSLNNNLLLEQHFEQLKRAQEHLLQQQQQQQQQNLAQEHQRQQAAALELKEEGLPQCKIKRNYSCNYCTYFTQNPRYHLTHLRDVHGEKIVINKCKLCLYASRHYQKLVRHMKMVHGCTEGITSGHGQARGKRGMNREARKRKLEESVAPTAGAISALSVEKINAEHMKSDMEHQKLQRDIEAFKKQQEEQQKSQQQKLNEAIFAAAYEQQLRAQREFDNRESIKPVAHSNYEQQTSAVTQRESSPSQSRTIDNATPAHHQQHLTPQLQMTPQRSSFELTPSPSGSNSSPTPELLPTGQHHSDALSGGSGASDEPSNNRLMKCSLCDFTTLYRNHLLEHEVEDHCNAKFYRCEKCSYVTHIKARFSKHVKYHSMPMIKCVTCDFRTPYKWNLDRHMKNHGGAGPFKCAACDFTADIKQSLTVHEMNHHVPPVGHAAGMTLARRRNKVGGTDLNEDFFSDSAEMLEDHFNNNNNNIDEYDEMLMTAGPIGVYDSKRLRYDDDEPTDLSQKGGSSDTSSVHNSNLSIPKAKKPLPNLIPITKEGENILNLSTDLASRSSLSDIASMFFNEKQISEMLQPTDKTDAMVGATSQLSPTTTITSTVSNKSLLNRKAGSFFDKIKSSSTTNENLICPCGHMAKYLSESIIHRKTCTFSPLSTNEDIDLDGDEQDDDADEGRLEIDFTEDEECDKQSHSALNLSVTGSTRCQHCRHRCKSSVDLLNHLKVCSEANSHCDSMSGESCAGSRVMLGDTSTNELQHPMENRVFIWNKLPRNQQEAGGSGSQSSDGNRPQPSSGNSSSNAGASLLSANNDENSYYGVETAPGYGEVTKKMTPEEEAANSSLKKVYKCPHCSFWASTASRFHVHIVGHLNKKPFECSLCSYRSNWRWDITKHIRLKTIRDPSHKNARVLMNDETGRRNYTKYNKYITLMKVTEEDGDPKLMKSGEMTPNQVASLAFINDFNNKQQGVINSSNSTVNNILNGVREDITLEPIPSKPTIDDPLPGNFVRLPLLASMVNAAMAQQQQQQHNESEQNATTTLITPSVTISAIKKPSPTNPNFKPSDEIALEVRQEGNEQITNYKCRKCNFRHTNRDAVLAHVKVHFPDAIQATNSSKSVQQLTNSNNNIGPLQTSVHSNLYMNKVLAAMCLSQQQQQQQHNSNTNAQLSNLVAAGLLDQASSSHLSGLALALTGKSPIKSAHFNAAANIIEHGEQKASLNEASAQNTTTSPNQLTNKNAHIQQQQPLPQTNATSSSSVTGVGSTALINSPSLQHLLTSPRGSISQTSNLNINNNNDKMVMGSTLLTNKSGLMTAMSPSPPSATPNTIVTTTTTPSPSSTPTHAYQVKQSPFSLHSGGESGLLTCDIIGGGIQDSHLNHSMVINGSDHIPTSAKATSLTAASSCSTSLLSLSNQNYIQNQNHSSSSSNNNINLGNLSGNGVLSNNNSNYNNINDNVNANGIGIGNGNNNNNNNLLTHDTTTADRRDPSPYRCGHCHQVSNWKHVIQRHCRLKHAGVINIETLDRTASAERNAPAVYKPLVNGATNESSSTSNNNSNNANSQYNLTLKALQHQQQQQQQNNSPNSVLINNNNNNNIKIANNVLEADSMNALMYEGMCINNNIQAAAAAILAATYKAVANQSSNPNNFPKLPAIAEELLLQQQLQQNDQIEITRVSSSNNNNNNNNNISGISNTMPTSHPITTSSSNLAHLLESNLNNTSNRVTSPQQNTKSKQQKCPLCTYICDSKSQMNYHISLHKPTQYECRMCTFVCAKKQHLSSHMRTVHQMHNNQILAATTPSPANTNGINMDFGLAMQMASTAPKQDTTNLTTSLAIDLSSTPMTRSNSALMQNHQSQLPPEYQYRMIYYCNKCPARYAQKHNDPLTVQKDLDEHLRQHEASTNISNEDKRKYHCDYCDYRAIHESIIQTHRYVHSTQYQEKCNELYKNCKEDSVYRAPKLMHITATKKPHKHETIWVVDHDLNEQQQQAKQHQNSVITSSSHNNTYKVGNSLLKKQLELRQGTATGTATTTTTPLANEEVSKKLNETEIEDSNIPSTSNSVDVTGDLGHESESRPVPVSTPEETSQEKSRTDNETNERCEHCPFKSSNEEEFKTHIQQHMCVSQQKRTYSCEHCDYSAEEQEQIEEHTRVHFNGIEKLKDVSFFTRYDKLELSMEQQKCDDNTETDNLNIKKELQNHNNNNNNNEENRVNENLKESPKESSLSQQKQPKCAKIILYKNDGCLTIKKETNEPAPTQNHQQQPANTVTENISDRLRRRISRQGAAGGANNTTSNQEDQALTTTSSSSHKTILVNAKTGQVISRN